MSFCAFIVVSLPAYFNATKVTSKEDPVRRQENGPDKVMFSGLFKTCCSAVLSDYKISLLSKIPLAIQVLAAGSVLYSIFGLDWVMHFLAGFSIGVFVSKVNAPRLYKKLGYSDGDIFVIRSCDTDSFGLLARS